jgi:uncharacterized protein YjbI with pentapeptide repeats
LSPGLPWQHKAPPIPAKFSGFNNFMSTCIGANLQDASLSNADLRWTNFRGANLRKADLTASVLWGAILTKADLTGADLSQADFTGADLVGADLSNAIVDGACFLGARFGKSTRFPKKFGDPEKKGMVSLNESMQLS